MKKFVRQGTALAAVLATAVLALSGCGRGAAGGRGGGDQPEIVYAVNTTTAVQGRIRDYFALSGDVIAASTVDAFSDAAGRVSRLFVTVGSQVRLDDPIAEVDPSRPGMEFVPSLVRSPVAGTVVTLPAQLGMTVNQAFPMARVATDGGLEIRLFVAERFISQVALNQPGEIVLNAWPGETFHGNIIELSPVLDPVSRTMEIRVGVNDPGTRLKAGMFAQVRIITEQREGAVQIPAAAMVNRYGEQFIFVADYADPDAPVARRRDVVSGIMIDGVMEVQQGLAPGEEVVIRGQTVIYDGARINIVDRVQPLNVN
ncbi:MAG: efflux RND transporter periplasmic adaptor subunit [Treponema sp.]|nr:efflux RND transporter periplasmic adaptor subunit [Treponema sp.]